MSEAKEEGLPSATPLPSPENSSSVPSKVVVEWLTPLMLLASRRALQETDLFEMAPQYSAEELGSDMSARLDSVRKQFAKDHPEVDLSSNTINKDLQDLVKKNMFLGFLASFKKEWILGAIYGFCGTGFAIASPMILQAILLNVTNGNRTMAFVCCVLMFLSQILSSLFVNSRIRNEVKVSVAMRTIVYAAVFRKAMFLSSAAKQEYPTGRIVNMLSTDAGMVEMVGYGIHSIWLVPVQIVVMSALIIYLLGVGGAVGIAVLVCISVSQTFAMKAIFKYDMLAMVASDARVRKTTEMLAGMKIIKLFAWEDSFIKEIQDHRKQELRNIFLEVIIAAVFYGMVYVIPTLVSVVSFAVYSEQGNLLTADVIFPALSLINLLRGPMMELPEKIQGMIEANVSFNRFARFLACPELDESRLLGNGAAASPSEGKIAVSCTNASFMWEDWAGAAEDEHGNEDVNATVLSKMSDKMSNLLQNVSLEIPKGKLVAIVGAVGAGKSSLLQGLLGEMKTTAGSVALKGTVAYASQQGWLQNSTLQANVLFNTPMNRERYEMVLSACSLDKDIQNFPNGELTEVGERGVQLSGGQVARVNLARSIYSNADIMLLDDPLAAVDAHVGRHIFEVAIKQTCAGKTVLLVTHQLNLLPEVDLIVYLEDGNISEVGTYTELMQANQGLSTLISEYGITREVNDTATTTVAALRNAEPSSKKLKVEDVTQDGPKTVMMVEERIEGAVTWYHYKTYIALSGGVPAWTGIFLVAVAINVVRVINDYWLIWWSANAFSLPNSAYIGIYASLGVGQALLTILLAVIVARTGITGARNLHTNALMSIGRAPMSFFDTNPLGRIINRFSRDVAECDRWLVMNLRGVINIMAGILCMVGLIGYAVPSVLIVIVLVTPIYYFIQRFYRNASRELKRLENLSRSPFFANCAESFNGLATIRAFKASSQFVKTNESLIDAVNRPTILRYFVSIWVSMRAETFVAVVCLAVSTMGVGFNISPNLLGLSIGYTLNLVFTVNILMHIMSEGEGRMNSVERLDHYHTNIPSEAAMDLPEPAIGWPLKGAIVFKEAEMRYRPDLPPVLKNLSFEIGPREKIGIVGRTGAGKSSIISALYRLVELSNGSVEIDGIDLATVGLRKLRTSLSIIPQAPILFQGTIRSNIDPLNRFDDSAVWTVLEHASMKEYVSNLDDKLNATVQENGENLSVGQRQLLCLARAMLVEPKILLIDEATASVDIKTDSAIQKALRTSFSTSTILCVAHRLLTIIDYDRVLVLKDGEVSEYDTPKNLLENPDSLFTDLVNETGPDMAALLKMMAGKGFGEVPIEF